MGAAAGNDNRSSPDRPYTLARKGERTLATYNDPGLASPASPYDDPTPCPECGIGDAEYGVHEVDCPSGYPTKEPEQDAFDQTVWEYENDTEATVGLGYVSLSGTLPAKVLR